MSSLNSDSLQDVFNFSLEMRVIFEQKQLLGHSFLLHGSVSELDPRHSLPPFVGTGLIQYLNLSRIPYLPHGSVHSRQDCHAPQAKNCCNVNFLNYCPSVPIQKKNPHWNLFNAWIKLQKCTRDFNPLGAERKLNVHKMFARCPGLIFKWNVIDTSWNDVIWNHDLMEITLLHIP